MVEFILDIVFDIILEGSVQLTTAKKVPMLLRILAFLVVLALYFGVSGFFFYIGYNEAETIGSLLCYGVGVVILIAGIYQTYKMYKQRKEES